MEPTKSRLIASVDDETWKAIRIIGINEEMTTAEVLKFLVHIYDTLKDQKRSK